MSSGASTHLSSEDREQIMQTIEMFEVITQANPNDVHSLEILKDAYWKLDLNQEAIDTTRRLADTFVALGQYSSAVMVYENILEKDPDNPEIFALLGNIEAKLSANGGDDLRKPDNDSNAGDFDIDFDLGTPDRYDANLIETDGTKKAIGAAPVVDLKNDGNDALAKFLTQHRIAPEQIVETSLERIRKINGASNSNTISASLIAEIAETNAVGMDEMLNGILDGTKFAYIPLEFYDIDRQIVKMLPESLTIGRLIVPFDLMSRTVMVAMANPFDAEGKEVVQQLFDYNIQWHLASPAAIKKVLASVYKIARP